MASGVPASCGRESGSHEGGLLEHRRGADGNVEREEGTDVNLIEPLPQDSQHLLGPAPAPRSLSWGPGQVILTTGAGVGAQPMSTRPAQKPRKLRALTAPLPSCSRTAFTRPKHVPLLTLFIS